MSITHRLVTQTVVISVLSVCIAIKAKQFTVNQVLLESDRTALSR